ncbi:Cadherin-like protein [Ceratocystis lukuohia]|uniref:Cadherin-like protein n=1 Tax=Ceratocystis lukuohia TaxID=2019550 RepID=A0ABR4MPI6_9PEZI
MILVASDSEGSAEMNATIVVSKNPAPALLKPLEDQISGFGDFSAPSSLLLYPSTAFNFSFDPSTFANALGSLDYYAVSGDGSPLPAWVRFNSETLQFSGTSPPFESLISPPQVFDLQFVASDVPGFSAISMSFDITVGTRKLTSENPIIVLNVTKGDTISYDGLKDEIELDGGRVSPGNLTVDTENMPSWVSFNEDSWDISGTAPSEAESTKFLIQFKDSLSDSLGVQVVVNIADSLFTDKIPSIKIVPGETVDFDFARYVSNASDVAITIDSNQSWLKINGLKLAGTAPGDLQPSTFQLTVTANSQTLTGVKQTIQAVVDITDETGSGSDGSHKKSDKLSKAQISLVVILPIVCAILLTGIVICLVKHRRRRNPRPKTIIVEEIIGPLPSDLRRDETRTSFDERSPTDSEYRYIDNFPFHGHQSKTYGNQGGGLRGAYSDSDMARDLTVDTRTARSFSESGPRRSESWVTIEANPRSPQKAFMSKASRLGRDATFQSEAVSNADQSSWYTEPQTSSFRREPDLSAPSLPDLPDLGSFPEMPETRRSLDMSSDRDVPMVDILDQEARRSEEVTRTKEQEEEEEDQELPQIQNGTDRSLPDIPSSEALPSIRESSTPSPPPPAHLSSLLGNVRRPQSPPMVHVWPDATPHPDDATPTPLSLSRNPSLSQAEKGPLSNRTTHYSYIPGEPSIPRKSSRRTGGQGSLTSSKSNSNLNMRVSLGPRMNERHKQPTTASLESMQGKENQLAADNWKSGASREYLDIPYRDLYGGTASSGSTRRSVSSAESRSYSSGSRQSSLGGSSDRRRMTHNGPSRRKASGSRRTSGSAVSDEFMQSIPIGYEGDNPRSMGLPYLGYGEYPVSKPSFITAREFQSMSTVNSLGTEGGFI